VALSALLVAAAFSSAAFTSSTTTYNTVAKVLSAGQPVNAALPAPESGWNGWTSASNNPRPTPAGRWPDMTAWFQCFSDPTAPFAWPGSVFIEMKNIETYVHSRSGNRWVRVQDARTVDGSWYTDNWQRSVPARWLVQPDGGVATAIPTAGQFVHGWPSGGRGTLPVADSDIDSEYVTAQARLFGPAASGPTAKIECNLGADWWVNATAANNGNTGPSGNNEQVLSGPMAHLTTQWNSYSAWPSSALAQMPGGGSWTAAQMAASSPPLNGMGQP
jgi:hypothetical protein